MILYIESKAFPHRTFVVRLQPFETVARIRAQMLHILYELGRDNHQFRLRYKGQYLRDAYTLEDYGIISNSIIKMIPLSKHSNSVVDLRSLEEERSTPPVLGQEQDVKDALLKEITVFNQRERLIYDFRGLLYLHFMAIWLSFLTSYWWSGFWTAAVFLFGVYYCPTFTRMGGFIGKHSIYKFHFCIIYGIASLVNMGASVYLGTREWVRVINHGCKDWVFVDDCSHQVIYSGLFFCIQALCLAISSIIAWVLLWNMKVEYGDYVERHLVQTRDIEEVMKAAKSGRTKEKRVAAFELATLAASGDDNKFRIVAEGGLDVLIRMVLGRDESTQEHAMEALAELLTVPSIQDTFVEMGGMRTLTAVMHASSQRLIYEAAMAISYVVSDSEENKTAVTANHGLDDLCYAAQHAGAATKRVIAGTFLELAFNEEIRAQMTARDTTAKALVQLCLSADPDTQRYALQTLELLAIESADMICAQEELLDLLLELPSRTSDQDVHLLACKILLYYAESPQTCETLLFKAGVREALTKYSHGRDPMLQKVVIKVIYCAAEDKLLRAKADELQLTQVLKYIRTHAADREVWDMADQAIQTFESDENLTSLPPLSAAEKIQRMDSKNKADLIRKEFGSKASLGSRTSLHSGSSAELKKSL